MATRSRSRALAALAAAGTLVVLVAVVVLLARGRSVEVLYGLWIVQNGPSSILLLWMAYLVLRRYPRHNAGRILLAIGVTQVLHVVVATIADLRLVAAGVDIPLVGDHGLVSADLPLDAAIWLWIMNWLWVPAAVLAVLLLLVFPDGRLPGPGWRWTRALAGLAAALLAGGAGIDGWPTADWAVGEEPAIVGILMLAGGACALALAVAGIVAFAIRWRRAGAELRRFQVVGGTAIGFVLLAILTYPWPPVWVPVVHVAFNALILVYGLAIARYRLHDLEPVLGRSAVAALLSVLVAAIYLLVVVVAGRLVGTGIDDPLLPLVAVGLVALLIEPARRRARRLVDRWLYGRSADRGDVLSRLADRASVGGAEVLDEVVELLLRSTGAARAEAWTETWSAATGHAGPAAAAGVLVAGEPRALAEIGHRGERFGELRLYARAAADLVPEAAVLLGDAARLLGVVLRNERLALRLEEQLSQTRASRQRLVEAQEQARRGLERDLHDGAQARLIALRLRVGALRSLAAEQGGPALDEPLDGLGRELDAAVRQLRELARGLHPPMLEQAGLAAALRAHVRDLPVPIAVTASGTVRYPRAVEGAVYFSCLEAVQNALRHAAATEITIELDCAPAELRVSVRDDGRGFQPGAAPGTGLGNIDDRVSALGGQVRVDSSPDSGTRVDVVIPIQPSAAAR